MARRLTSINPIGYLGVSAPNPPNMIKEFRRPTFRDINYPLGTLWFIPKQSAPPSEELWQLTGQANNYADWTELGSGGSVVPGPQYSLLTSDGSGSFGTGVGPAIAGYILVAQGASDYPAFIQPTAGAGLSLVSNATTLEFSLDVPIDVADGGTGQTDLDEFNVLVGNGTNGISQIPPSATAGIPLVSKGLAADPEFDTAEVVGGGTGQTSFTANQVVIGGTTSTGALQQVPAGTSGQILQSNGASAPSWVNKPTGDVTVKVTEYTTGSGNHDIDNDCFAVKVILVGAGAGGDKGIKAGATGGGQAGAPGSLFISGILDVTEIGGSGASISYSVGLGGSGGTATGQSGSNGSATSFGSFAAAGGDNNGLFVTAQGFNSGGTFSTSYNASRGNYQSYGSSISYTYRNRLVGVGSLLNPNQLNVNTGSVPDSVGTGAPTIGGRAQEAGGNIVNQAGTLLLAGGTAGSSVGPTNAGNGQDATFLFGIFGGTGGGGGYSRDASSTLTAGTGGSGGYPGGGGGCGGSQLNAGSVAASGNGGAGGNGYVRVVEYINA